jgi:Golgi nucleoside diphosphatase
MVQELPSVDSEGNPYNYIVVIDAGSKGSRAHLYRTKHFGDAIETGKELPTDSKGNGEHVDDSDSDSDSDDEDDYESEKKKGGKVVRDWKAKSETLKSSSTPLTYPEIELIKHKKVKPGIASFVQHPKKLGKKYIGKLLDSILKSVPQDQIERTPIFLHATGGTRLLKPDEQDIILNYICEYIQDKSDLFLPDCKSHINTISGETEGLYSWIGLNYKYGILDSQSNDNSTLGMLDMGGVSSQIAFEPENFDNEKVLIKLNLNYLNEQDSLQYHVFSRSLLSGMHQAHTKYDESLIAKNDNVDPCLPLDYIKTVEGKDGKKVDIEGGGNFENCLNSLYDLLLEVSTDKSCNQSDIHYASSCLLSDELPKMDFNVSKFIGVNGFYSNLKQFVNYQEFYRSTKKICESSYTQLLENKQFKDEIEKSSEICFKSSWIIDVLHQGVNFPRYGIDEVDSSKDIASNDETFGILDEYSWTLGRAVLYSYFETAQFLNGNVTVPQIGYYEPSSKMFHYGGEIPGVPPRPEYVRGSGKSYKTIDNDEDNDEEHDDDWDDVLEDHRLWGSLFMLIIFMMIAYLLLGKVRRQAMKDSIRRFWQQKFGGNYRPVTIDNNSLDDELELGEFDIDLDNIDRDDRSRNISENQRGKNKNSDSFELSE